MFRFRELMHRIWMRPWVWQQHSHRWSWDDWCFLILFVLLLRDIPAACRQTYSSCWNACIQKQWLYSCWYKQLGNWRQWIAGYELLSYRKWYWFFQSFLSTFCFLLENSCTRISLSFVCNKSSTHIAKDFSHRPPAHKIWNFNPLSDVLVWAW